jgi:NADH-quinone oxidoreductase subunit C
MTDPTMTGDAGAATAGVNHPLHELRANIVRILGEHASLVSDRNGELTYEIGADGLLEAARMLRDGDGLKFEMCMDVCGVDYLEHGRAEWKTQAATESGFSRGVSGLTPPDWTPPEILAAGRRFAVVYHLLSVSLNQRVRLRVYCADDAQPMVDSVTGIWASADWFERETFDLFGILFRGHPDLRRLLTDYGFIGHPFRKDFPLTGNVEVRYDPEKARVVYQPVSIDPRVLVPKVIRHDNRYDPALTNAPVGGSAVKPNG